MVEARRQAAGAGAQRTGRGHPGHAGRRERSDLPALGSAFVLHRGKKIVERYRLAASPRRSLTRQAIRNSVANRPRAGIVLADDNCRLDQADFNLSPRHPTHGISPALTA